MIMRRAGQAACRPAPFEHLRHEAQGTVEPKGQHRGRHIVLDRFRDADRLEPFPAELPEDAETSSFDGRDDRIDPFSLDHPRKHTPDFKPQDFSLKLVVVSPSSNV